jgi:hypothetical protein
MQDRARRDDAGQRSDQWNEWEVGLPNLHRRVNIEDEYAPFPR